jgi:hypothetical protein
MPLFLILGLAYVINEAIWGTTEYVGDQAKGPLTRFGEWLDRKVKTNPLEGDATVGRVLGWSACGAAWLAGKTLKHGAGVAKVIGKSSKEGWAKARSDYAWAKNEKKILKDHREALEINKRVKAGEEASRVARKVAKGRTRRLSWEDLIRARKQNRPEEAFGGSSEDERQEALKGQPQNERPTTPPPSPPPPPAGEGATFTAEQLYPDPPAPPAPPVQVEQGDPIAALVAAPQAEVVEDEPVHERDEIFEAELVYDPNPALALPARAITTGATVSIEINHEVQGLAGARAILRQAQSILADEAAQTEARFNDAVRGAVRLGDVRAAMESLIDGLGKYDMDSETIGDAWKILECVGLAELAAQQGANADAVAREQMFNAGTAADDTYNNMQARHGALEEAHRTAPVAAAVREAYTDGQ